MLKHAALTLFAAVLTVPAVAAGQQDEDALRAQLEQARRQAEQARDLVQVAEAQARQALEEANQHRAVVEQAKAEAQRQAALAERRLAEALEQANQQEAEEVRLQAERRQLELRIHELMDQVRELQLALGRASEGAEDKPRPEGEIRVFRLAHATPREVMPVLEELLIADDPGLKVVPYERTNSVIARGEREALARLEALLTELDREE